MRSLNCDMMYEKGGKCIHHIDAYTPTDAGFCDVGSRFRCIEDLKTTLPSMSHSAALAWIRCKMYYKYFYLMGIRCKNLYLPVQMKRGTVWDLFMNSMNTGQGINTADLDQLVKDLALEDKDIAKINALADAYRDLEIKASPGVEQKKFAIPFFESSINGIIDWACEDGFEENKLSGSPEWYTKIENVYQQIGTYFLSNDRFEYVDMKIARAPDLKTGWGKKREETIDEYYERTYSDIISRPAYYFLGYDSKTRTWGKRYWRKEFDLEYLANMYRWVLKEIRDTIDRDSFYRNDNSCWGPGNQPCIYQSIKRSGVVSDIIYYRAPVGGNK